MRRAGLSLLAALAAGPAAADGDRIVHREKSLYRNILVVEGDGLRCLQFGRRSARQTCIEPARPERLVLDYTRALLAGLYMVEEPRRILMIGLGGGVIPMAVTRARADIRVSSVEVDGAVVAVARTHFGFVDAPTRTVHVDDGRVFVKRARRAGERYDLVLIDAFDKDYVPESLLTREFLAEVRELLAPGGAVAANTWARAALRRHETATYQAVFGDLYNLETAQGNRIILAGADGLPALDRLRARAAQWQPGLAATGIDGQTLIDGLVVPLREDGVRVLTDQFSPSNLLLGR